MTIVERRSDLRRAAVRPDRRRRNYLRRYVWATIILGIIVVYIWAIRARAVPLDGIGWVIYGFHDQIWLPIYGSVWLKYAPFSLIWVVPVAAITLFVLLEWLGLLGAIRAAQISALRWLLYRQIGRTLIWLFSYIPLTGRSLLAGLVLDAEIDDIAARIKLGVERRADFRNLARLARYRTRLERSADNILRDAEVAVLVRWAHPEPKVANRLLRGWAKPLVQRLTARFADQPGEDLSRILCETWLKKGATGAGPDSTEPILLQAARLRQNTATSIELTELAILTAINAAGGPHARALVVAISQYGVRHIWSDRTGAASAVEAAQNTAPSIDQGFWLAQIEKRLDGPTKEASEPDPGVYAIEQTGPPRNLGEVFALTGERP